MHTVIPTYVYVLLPLFTATCFAIASLLVRPNRSTMAVLGEMNPSYRSDALTDADRAFLKEFWDDEA